MTQFSSIPALNQWADIDESELLADAVAVGLPMNTVFRKTRVREALLVRGPAGWAEFSPFPEYGTPEAANWLAATVEAGWHGWPEPLRDTVDVNATVPAVPASQVEQVLAKYPGATTVKVKVAEQPATGQDPDPDIHGLEADLARVRAVREAAPHAKLRVDANQAWTVDEAAEALRALAPLELEYAEQPVPGIDGLVALRAALARDGVPVKLAADEAVRKAEDPLAVAQAGAADVVVVKVQPLGGVHRALAITQAAGLETVVSSALDTSVGIAGGVALAAAIEGQHLACGLGTAALFSKDVTSEPRIPVDGKLSVGRVEVDENRLTELQLAPERSAWWMQRAADALRYLKSQN